MIESLRGPAQNIGYDIRVFGLDGTMLLGAIPVILFPFSQNAWIIAGLNCIGIIVATQMNIPSKQIPRRLLSMLRPTILVPTYSQVNRKLFRPWPY